MRKAAITLELGKAYSFTGESGQKRRIVVRGSRHTHDGDVLILEVNGAPGEYRSLHDALGEAWTNIATREP